MSITYNDSLNQSKKEAEKDEHLDSKIKTVSDLFNNTNYKFIYNIYNILLNNENNSKNKDNIETVIFIILIFIYEDIYIEDKEIKKKKEYLKKLENDIKDLSLQNSDYKKIEKEINNVKKNILFLEDKEINKICNVYFKYLDKFKNIHLNNDNNYLSMVYYAYLQKIYDLGIKEIINNQK